jgi:hypothetical protein
VQRARKQAASCRCRCACAAAFAGAAIDGDEFADQVAIADDSSVRSPAEFHVLRIAAQRSELCNAVVASDSRRPFDHHMRTDDGAIADMHIGTNHRVSTDATRWRR